MVRSYRDNASSTSASSRPAPADRDLPSEDGDYSPRPPSPSAPASPAPPPRPRPRRRPPTPETPSSSPVAAAAAAAPDDFVDVAPPASDFEVAENGRLVSREEIAQQLLRVCVEGRELTVLLGQASAEWWNSPATRAQRAFLRAQLAAAGKGAFRVAKTALIGDGGRAAREADEAEEAQRRDSLLGYYARGAVRGLTGGVFGGVAAASTATTAAAAAASHQQPQDHGMDDFDDDDFDDFDLGMFDVNDEVEDDYGSDAREPRREAAHEAPAAAWAADEDETLGLPFAENEEW